MKRCTVLLASMVVMASIGSVAASPARTASGSHNGIAWQAQSTVVGYGSTDLLSLGGNPIYAAAMPQYSGVVALNVTYGSGSFLCTGTLLADRQSILTAAHCVTSGPTLARPDAVDAWFYGGSNPDAAVAGNAAATPVAASQYFVNPGYTGQVVDQNDIAVVRLSVPAPAWALSYQLATTADVTGLGFNVAGYGGRSNAGGSVGANLSANVLRQGDNRYDYRWGDAAFGGYYNGFFDQGGLPAAQVAYSYVADFDDGTAARDAAGLLAAGFGLNGAPWANLGRGLTEATVAPGDSGGPQFADGRITSVASYALSFGTAGGDLDDAENATFGEFAGYVPVYIHTAFINATLVPEPRSAALLALGLAIVGIAKRRR